MKDMILFFTTMAIFRMGLSIMGKIDEFIAENQQESEQESRQKYRQEYPDKKQDTGLGLFIIAKKRIL